MTIFSWKGPIDTVMTRWIRLNITRRSLQGGFMGHGTADRLCTGLGGRQRLSFLPVRPRKSGSSPGRFDLQAFPLHAGDAGRLFTLLQYRTHASIFDLPTGETWSPENADAKYGGMLTLKEGLAESVNCVSAYLDEAIRSSGHDRDLPEDGYLRPDRRGTCDLPGYT